MLLRSALALLLLAIAAPAHAAPDVGGALRALVATPFRVTGDLVGAGGLVAAAALGLCGDGISLVDANRWTEPILFGVGSGAVRHLALGLSQGATGALEGLRAEDIERLPEARAAYLENAPGVGRVDTALTGLGALRLGVEDALTGPAVFALRAVGARAAANRVTDWTRDERIRALGPLASPD
ncbi:MAG TPA: hypothetical protein VKF60_14125 [Myxococcota bacterium]|nr:hypothetical protein [Myxococcota bacterium]